MEREESKDFNLSCLDDLVGFAKRHDLFDALCSKLGRDTSFFEDNHGRWENIDLLEKFYFNLFFLYRAKYVKDPLGKNISTFISYLNKETVRNKKLPLFRFAISIFVDPKSVWQRLPDLVASTMNYCCVEYHHIEDSLLYSKGLLVQKYKDPERVELNSLFSDMCFDSIKGLSDALGSSLVYVHRKKSVANGDGYCEFEFQWIRKSNLRYWGSGLLVFFILSILSYAFLTSELVIHGIIHSALLSRVAVVFFRGKLEFTRNGEAFDQQREMMEELVQRVNSHRLVDIELVKTRADLEKSIKLATAGELSYSYLHDMESAISVIVMSTEILRNSLEEREVTPRGGLSQIETLESAGEQLVKMQNLIRRAAGGDTACEKATCPVKVSLDSAINLVMPIARQNRVNIKTDISFDFSDHVLANEGGLESSLLNLINNAVRAKFSNSQKEVKILGKKIGNRFQIVIQDNGCGIPDEVLENINQPFSSQKRIWEANKEQKIFSSGFGLYKVRQSILGMGGDMEIATSKSGTTITLWLRDALLDMHEVS